MVSLVIRVVYMIPCTYQWQSVAAFSDVALLHVFVLTRVEHDGH